MNTSISIYVKNKQTPKQNFFCPEYDSLLTIIFDDSRKVEDSVLAESQCRQVIGNEQLTFWMYLAIRCLADIFPTAAVALIDATIVIATRETSTGRGDVGRQLGKLFICIIILTIRKFIL